MASGKFLGFMVTQRGIQMNQEKIEAISCMPSPNSFEEVQVLSGRIVALGRFVSRLGDKFLYFFKVLRNVNTLEFQWMEECEKPFKI